MTNFYDATHRSGSFLIKLLFGKQPPAHVRWSNNDSLPNASGTRGALLTGDPASGKTRYAAMQLFKRMKENPRQAIFVFDWSGSIINSLLDLILRDPDYKELLKRVVLDELGNEDWIIPKPEFHPAYGLTDEEQVNRVIGNIERLSVFMQKSAGFLTQTSKEIGKELFRLLTAIKNEHGESWQITEAKRLLVDVNLLENAVKYYGHSQKSAQWFFKHEYLPNEYMKGAEKELSTKALRNILSSIDSRVVRATLGYFRPGWTPKEATEKGQLVLIDAHKMINQPDAQHYLLMQNFSLVMNWINKREVDDPTYEPITIAFDETYTILKIPGMAEWLGMVSPIYRARKIQLLIIIQALWQLDEELARQIWSLGNVVSFAMSNADEAKTMARQLFTYDPKYVKHTPKTEYQNATTESEDGQDRLIADWIQTLKPREFIMRRFITEQERDSGVIYVPKTSEFPNNPPFEDRNEVKLWLLRGRGVPVREALNEVNKKAEDHLNGINKSKPGNSKKKNDKKSEGPTYV